MHVILDIFSHGIPDFLTLGIRHTFSRAAEITVKIGSVDEPRCDDFDAGVKGCEDAGSPHQMIYESLAGRQEEAGEKKHRKLIRSTNEFALFLRVPFTPKLIEELYISLRVRVHVRFRGLVPLVGKRSADRNLANRQQLYFRMLQLSSPNNSRHSKQYKVLIN